jgi:exosortase/archaeosortase family protein
MDFLKKNKDIVGFLIKLGILYVAYFWWFSPNVWQLPVISTLYGYFIHYVLLFLAEPAALLLTAIGFGADVVNDRYLDLYDLEFNVHIKNFCLGIDMMFMLTALIISFPGKWKDRLWFIPMGVLGIQLINIGRIVGLCLSFLLFKRGNFVDHHDVFNVVAVIFIFFLFVMWVNRYQKKEPV